VRFSGFAVGALSALSVVSLHAVSLDQPAAVTVAFTFSANKMAPRTYQPYVIGLAVLPVPGGGTLTVDAKHAGQTLNCTIPVSNVGTGSCSFVFGAQGTWKIDAHFDGYRATKSQKASGESTVSITVGK
jgi:hypothetical protein